jgi:gamma-glutamylcyclotransferase (GGCT)/AIG2-like uncharacterized protein YtfP
MTRKINKLFVYGTLLQGELKGQHLEGCNLVETLELPGKLYYTQQGYPAALFDTDSRETVTGELYKICGDVDERLGELDKVEGAELGLYIRKCLRYKEHDFYLYEAGEVLKKSLHSRNGIKSGSWRRYGSVALRNPLRFALTFENSQLPRYREFPPQDSSGSVFLRGEIPVLVTASHATAHLRMNKIKYEEHYTGALSVILHVLTGSNALYTHWASEIDPNYYDDAPFKEKVSDIVQEFGIRFVIDLHGTIAKTHEDIYPGIGIEREFLLGNDFYLAKLEESVESEGFILGGLHVFPASRQMTIAKFLARNLGIPALQLEINKRLRRPESNPSGFERLVKFLKNYIYHIRGKF